MSDWKVRQVEETLDAFFAQFGEFNDNSRVVLEVIFEEIYGTKALSLLGKKRQEGDDVGVFVPVEQKNSSDEGR